MFPTLGPPYFDEGLNKRFVPVNPSYNFICVCVFEKLTICGIIFLYENVVRDFFVRKKNRREHGVK